MKQLIIKTDVIEQKYLAFKDKEVNELERARKEATDTAQKLGWNEVDTKQMVDFVTGKAEAQLANEKAYWNEIVEEVDVAEPEAETETEVQEPIA